MLFNKKVYKLKMFPKIMGKRVVRMRLNKPYPSTRKDKKFMVLVRNPKTKRTKTIHFGQKGYKHNYSKKARILYLKRSAGIRDKHGRLTKNNKMSANYWSRHFLWKVK